MIALELISQSITPTKTSDSGEDVLFMMNLLQVRHLPIVNQEQFLGLISESDILAHDPKDAIGSYRLSMMRPFCYEDEHIFEIMGKVSKFDLTLIPVVDKNENYLGVIKMERLLRYFADSFAFTEPGSILIIETTIKNYSMADICRIIEGENIGILSTFLHKDPDSTRVLITIKTNQRDILRAKQTLERFGFEVSSSFSDGDQNDGVKERYDLLMTYLNV